MASKLSIKKSVENIEEQPTEPFFTNFPDKPTYNDMWFDDPIEGEEAIRMSLALQKKIEEKATPIREWLVSEIGQATHVSIWQPTSSSTIHSETSTQKTSPSPSRSSKSP